MKKLLLKWNMALILVVILFANVSFAEVDYQALTNELNAIAVLGSVNVNFEGYGNNSVPYVAFNNEALSTLEQKYGGSIRIKDGKVIYKSNDGSEAKTIDIGLGYRGGETISADFGSSDGRYRGDAGALEGAIEIEDFSDVGQSKNYSFITFGGATYERFIEWMER